MFLLEQKSYFFPCVFTVEVLKKTVLVSKIIDMKLLLFLKKKRRIFAIKIYVYFFKGDVTICKTFNHLYSIL